MAINLNAVSFVTFMFCGLIFCVNCGDKDKYDEFNCYGQVGTGPIAKGFCDPKEKPKGCFALLKCSFKGEPKKDYRHCLFKSTMKDLDIKGEPEKLCELVGDKCEDCKVCQPKNGDGDYCNEPKENKAIDNQDNKAIDKQDNKAIDNQGNKAIDNQDNGAIGILGNGGLVTILLFGALAVLAMHIGCGIVVIC